MSAKTSKVFLNRKHFPVHTNAAFQVILNNANANLFLSHCVHYRRQKTASLKEQKKKEDKTKTKTPGSDSQKKIAGKTNENNKDGNSDGRYSLCINPLTL